MDRGIISINGGRVVVTPAANGTVESRMVWMTQYELAGLFKCFPAKVSSNIRSILKTRVLDARTVCRTYYYGNGNSVEQYNLEMIIALSFRIKSRNAEVFRKWMIRKIITGTTGKPIGIIGYRNNSTLLPN